MDYFRGRTAVLATMHGKEKVIVPLLEELGIKVIIPSTLDTDVFGTFTQDIGRTGNQLEAARAKAKAALALTGLDLAIASEGSFGADPQIPFVQSNLELILLVDTKNDLEIRGHHRSSETNINGSYVSSIKEARDLADQWGFPHHGLIVRSSENSKRHIYKDIVTYENLEKRLNRLLNRRFTKKMYIETDMRAHRNPTRMKNISKATNDLVKNMQNLCPECSMPGFVVIDTKRGVPCAWCSGPTDSPTALVFKCFKCEYTEDSALPESAPTADPGQCNYCNP